MNRDHYRMYSGAWSRQTPRTTAQRWPANPVSARSGFWRRLLLLICGH